MFAINMIHEFIKHNQTSSCSIFFVNWFSLDAMASSVSLNIDYEIKILKHRNQGFWYDKKNAVFL